MCGSAYMHVYMCTMYTPMPTDTRRGGFPRTGVMDCCKLFHAFLAL